MSKNTPGSPVLKFYGKYKEILLRTLHIKVHILAVYGPTHKFNVLNGHQTLKKRAAVNILIEKKEKTSISKAYTKLKKKVATFLFAAATLI